VGKRPQRIASTVAVSVVPPSSAVPAARKRARPSEQATMAVPSVRESALSTVAVPVLRQRTMMAMTQRAPAVIEEIPIDVGDLEDDPRAVTEALGRVNTQPHRVTIGTHMIEGRQSARVWILAATVAGLAVAATLLVVS
jgi:hypothetical protein